MADDSKINKQQAKESNAQEEAKQARKKLLIAVAFFGIAGVIIVVMQILPAKYGIDITGYGEYIGLMQIYRDEQIREALRDTKQTQKTDQIEIKSGEELEYKVYILENDNLKYSWKSDGGEIYAEFHGEPVGGHNALFQTHGKVAATEDAADFTIPFEGTHGWYWRNDNEEAVTVTLEMEGKFNLIGKKAATFSRTPE